MRKHTDCEDRCQILEHKGYHDCTNTGRCELFEAMNTPTPDEVAALIKRLREKDAAITGTLLACLQNPEFAALVVGLKAASQEARAILESLSPPAGMVMVPRPQEVITLAYCSLQLIFRNPEERERAKAMFSARERKE